MALYNVNHKIVAMHLMNFNNFYTFGNINKYPVHKFFTYFISDVNSASLYFT